MGKDIGKKGIFEAKSHGLVVRAEDSQLRGREFEF
jgi:hypothetical protein